MHLQWKYRYTTDCDIFLSTTVHANVVEESRNTGHLMTRTEVLSDTLVEPITVFALLTVHVIFRFDFFQYEFSKDSFVSKQGQLSFCKAILFILNDQKCLPLYL